MDERILDYRVTSDDLASCIDRIVGWIAAGETGRYFACVNPHSLEVARKDVLFQSALQEADLLVPDGIGVVFSSWILGGSIRQRITGSDVFHGLSRALSDGRGSRYFLLGSSEETLQRLARKISEDYPGIEVAGSYSPPFRAEFTEAENEEMVAAIRAANPDVVWVGMTAPKQEKWIFSHRSRLDVKFWGPIGAVFDFYTGQVKRPSAFIQRLGLEWLVRFARNPGRLWRRNLVSNPMFLGRAVGERFTRRSG